MSFDNYQSEMSFTPDENIEKQIDNIIEDSINNAGINNSSEKIENKVQEISKTYELNDENIQLFNKTLHQFLIIEEEIKVLKAAIKKRNDMKTNLEQILTTFLKKSTISHVKLNGTYAGKNLETVSKSTVVGVNKQVIVEILHEYFSDKPDIFEEIMKKISEKSIIKETTKVQIKSNKNYKKINSIENTVNEVDQYVNDIEDIPEDE